MTLTFRKSSSVALLAIIFSALAPCRVLVRAHCVHHDGHIDHIAVGCTPTMSPVPSDGPSTPPTDFPTESPAPSPSPSEIPSTSPSMSPAPSMKPTGSPSEIPTSFPSDSPTGPLLITVVGVELRLRNVTGEREMNLSDLKYFEEKTTLYLQNEVDQVPGVFKIEVENTLVTNQTLIQVNGNDTIMEKDSMLRKRSQLEQNQTDLIITMDVVVSAVLNRSESANLDVFFEDFFKLEDNQNKLRSMLEQENTFAKGIFFNGEIVSSERLSKKGSNGTAVTGIVLAIVALVVGSGLLWIWIQTRRIADRESTDPRKLTNLGTISKSYDSDDGNATGAEKPRRIRITTSDELRLIQYPKKLKENDALSSASSSQLMYIPTIMPTESNIEVPDTPGTAFGINEFGTPSNSNGFATPANANGFATPASANGIPTPVSTSGLVTPASVLSRGGNSTHIGASSKLLVPTIKPETAPALDISSAQILKDISSTTARKQKIPLPPNILGSIKSPFRREKKTAKSEDDYDYDRSSMFGAGVVAGMNNVSPSDRRRKRNAKLGNNTSHDMPPIEIGGPGVTTVAVVPYGKRKSTSRSLNSRSHPMVIGGPPDKSNSDARSTRTKNRDKHGVVDIVDEIAYLYSTNADPPPRNGDASI